MPPSYQSIVHFLIHPINRCIFLEAEAEEDEEQQDDLESDEATEDEEQDYPESDEATEDEVADAAEDNNPLEGKSGFYITGSVLLVFVRKCTESKALFQAV